MQLPQTVPSDNDFTKILEAWIPDLQHGIDDGKRRLTIWIGF